MGDISRYQRPSYRFSRNDYLSDSRRGLTDYEKELNPYFDVEMDKELEQRKKIQPLQWIFDRLQTGQYISANVANEIIKAFQYSQNPSKGDPWEAGDFINAVWQGITGERKGSYEDIIRDTLGRGTEKIFKGAKEGSRIAQIDYADVLGFLGDIVLDPMTYVTFGGASKGAQIAASQFADDAVRLMSKELAKNSDALAKLTRSKWSGEALDAALSATNKEKVFKVLMGQNDDLGRLLSQTYNEAKQRALNKTAEQLPNLASELVQRATGNAPEAMDEIMQKIVSGDYAKAGERFKARILGKETGVGKATQFADWRRQSWDRLSSFLRQKPSVVNTRNALWSVLNRGIVGDVRRALGIRNPYQNYLRAIEREQGDFFITHKSIENLREVLSPLQNLSDEQISKALSFSAEKEAITRKAIREGVNPDMLPISTTAIGESDKAVVDASYKIKEVMDNWNERASSIASELGETELNHYEWYIPEIFRFRASTPSQQMTRKYTFNEQKMQESKLLQFVFGINEDRANSIIANNLSGLSIDFREMLSSKALQQAKLEARYNMVKTFREFGLSFNDMPENVAKSLRMGGRDITQLGLKQIDHPAFEGYLFDYDVADIINRTMQVTGRDRTSIGKLFHSYTNWWKGMVLLSSGYTMRNFYSNTMMQFLRHGTRAFNPKELQQSVAAVAYIAQKSNPENIGKALKAMGKDEGWMQSLLNTRIGDLTIRDIAEEAHKRGAISENLMAFEGKTISEKVAGKTKTPIRDIARKANTFIENVPRFQSFLIDVADNGTNEATLSWAARQARELFIDYGNLTDFEQRVMKNVVPFYSWIRNNIVNQINGIALYPEMYKLVPQVENLIEYEDPEYDPELIPDWMRNENMFAISKSDEGVFRMFRPDFAYTDLNLLPFLWSEDRFLPYFSFDELKNDVVNATAPWLRELASRATDQGYNFFYREELGEKGDAPYLMRLFLSRPETMAFIDGFLRMIGIEDGSKLELDENGKLQIDAQMAQTLESFLPVLRQVEFLFYLPNATIPGFQEAIEKATGAKSDYEKTEQAMQVLSYYLGIKTREVDLQKEKEQLGWDIYYKARDILTEQRRSRPGYELRSTTARDRTRDSIRRLGG